MIVAPIGISCCPTSPSPDDFWLPLSGDAGEELFWKHPLFQNEMRFKRVQKMSFKRVQKMSLKKMSAKTGYVKRKEDH